MWYVFYYCVHLIMSIIWQNYILHFISDGFMPVKVDVWQSQHYKHTLLLDFYTLFEFPNLNSDFF